MTFSPDITDSVELVLRTSSERGAVESSGSLDAVLQATAFDLGWHLVSIAEPQGGSGGTLNDLAEIAAGIGRHAALIPVIDTAVAQWLHAELTGAVLAEPSDVVCLAWADGFAIDSSRGEWTINGDLREVPWLPHCQHLLLMVGTADSPCAGFVIDQCELTPFEPRRLRSGLPVAGLRFDRMALRPTYVFPTYDHFDQIRGLCTYRAATLNAAMLVGAAERACVLTSEHVRTRKQFGSALIRLQAVAHLLARAICERDLMTFAVSRALDAGGQGNNAAAAAAVVAHSSGQIATMCHQLHGAIGITEEYPLNSMTKQLWLQRDRYVSQREAEFKVGVFATTNPEEEVWEMIVDSGLGDLG